MANQFDKILKTLPQSEYGCQTTNKTNSGKVYIVSNCPEKHRFTLWEKLDEGYRRIDTSDSPLYFDSIIPWTS